jgi:hypothetical protein
MTGSHIENDTDYRDVRDLDALFRHPETPAERCVSCEASQIAEIGFDAILEDVDATGGQEELALVHAAAMCLRRVLEGYHSAGISIQDQWPVLVEYVRLLLPSEDYPLRKLDPNINIRPAAQLSPFAAGERHGDMTSDEVTDAMLTVQGRSVKGDA